MPTLRQKAAFKKVMENGGNVTKAMREAKYSPKTFRRPKVLTESKAWQKWMKLLDTAVPDKVLVDVLKDGLTATKVERIFITDAEEGESTHEKIEVADHLARHKYMVEGFKLKKKYPKEELDLTTHGTTHESIADEIEKRRKDAQQNS